MKLVITILTALLLLLQYDLWVGDGSLANVWRLNKDIQAQQQENTRLQERNAALTAEVQDLKQGLDSIEARARSELGMIHKDETFIQVIESSDEGRGTGIEKKK